MQVTRLVGKNGESIFAENHHLRTGKTILIKSVLIITTVRLFRHSRMLLSGIQVFQDDDKTEVTGFRLEPCRNDGLMLRDAQKSAVVL